MEVKSTVCGPITLTHKIGEDSAFSTVFGGYCNTFPVAIKISKSQSLKEEADALRILGEHEITARLIDYFTQDRYQVIIMEMLQMSLARYLNLEDASNLLELSYNLIRKLHVFHNLGYTHGDLHSNNIMYNDGQLYLIDLAPTHVSTDKQDLESLLDNLYLHPLDIATQEHGYKSKRYNEVESKIKIFDNFCRIAIKDIYGLEYVPQQQQQQQGQQGQQQQQQKQQGQQQGHQQQQKQQQQGQQR